jgi:CDP-diacylglycerol--glycerol-3-phosphate 3-phosphatidyltransferase
VKQNSASTTAFSFLCVFASLREIRFEIRFEIAFIAHAVTMRLSEMRAVCLKEHLADSVRRADAEVGAAMTLANKITISRILLIPVFVLFAVYYGQSVAEGNPQEWQRLTAIGVFLLASMTDGIDGWVARRFGQRSRLGAILDPIADKGLLLTAIITLSLSGWAIAFPLWFPVLVIARDVVIVGGCMVLKHLGGDLEVHPSWTGKTATALQMIAIAWVMLQLDFSVYPIAAAGVFTLISGVDYIFRGIGHLRHHDHPTT